MLTNVVFVFTTVSVKISPEQEKNRRKHLAYFISYFVN